MNEDIKAISRRLNTQILFGDSLDVLKGLIQLLEMVRINKTGEVGLFIDNLLDMLYVLKRNKEKLEGYIENKISLK